MAENEKPAPPAAPDPLSKEERAFFESRGETDPAPPPPPPPVADAAPPPPPEKPRDVDDVASPPADNKAPPQPTVPQAALHEERKRRQEAEEKARQMELLNARFEERFKAFRDAVTPRQPPPEAPPAPDQDIFGAVKHLQQEHTRTRQEIDGYKQQIQQEDNIKRLKQWGADAEAQFMKANPDYYQALTALRGARSRQLQVWGMSPSAIQAQLIHEEHQLLARAAAERRNPAQMAYDLAKESGYQKAAAPSPAAQPQGSARHEVDLNRIEAGQRQSNSLSTVGGGAGGRDVGDIEIDDLLKMNDREFAAFIDKYPAKFRRLKGAAH